MDGTRFAPVVRCCRRPCREWRLESACDLRGDLHATFRCPQPACQLRLRNARQTRQEFSAECSGDVFTCSRLVVTEKGTAVLARMLRPE